MPVWAERELVSAELGDRRRRDRAIALVADLASRPESSIPAACASKAKAKAAYRFLSNEAVHPAALRAAHREATLGRIGAEDGILIAQDTTALDFTTKAATRDLGPLDCAYCRGLKVHSALAMSECGVPLGVLHQEVWARDPESVGPGPTRRQRTTAEKESQRWIATLDVCEAGLPEAVRAWIVGDRESDLYDLFAAPRRAGLDLLVRAAQNRRVEGGEAAYLWEALAAAPRAGVYTLEVPRSRGRPARPATLEVRYTALEILPPRHARQRSTLSPIPLWVVWVKEVHASAGQAPLEWMLLSTRPVTSYAEARACVEAYRHRWKVERYHYVLKSGCKIEELQLEEAARLERALALYSVVAWRLLWLTYQARQAPQAPCTDALEEAEWQTLYLYTHRRPPPEEPPTLRQAVRWIATLGGFVGTRQQNPGVKTLWRGWRRLEDITAAYLLFHDVGNG